MVTLDPTYGTCEKCYRLVWLNTVDTMVADMPYGTCEKCGKGTPEARTVLVHLNVSVPAGDVRPADGIAAAILAAYEVGSDDDVVRNLDVECALAEEL